ncbi:response regulator [candidate division KSB1 bacterium]|nr:response regulator [candidate division KSB1 bacterium]
MNIKNKTRIHSEFGVNSKNVSDQPAQSFTDKELIFEILAQAGQFGFFVARMGEIIYLNRYATELLSEFIKTDREDISEEENYEKFAFENALNQAQTSREVLIREFQMAFSELSSRIRVVFEQVHLGSEVFVLGVVHDITEEKRGEEERRLLQEQVFRVQKMESLNTLARGLSHDFNNILSSILGNIALVSTESFEMVQKMNFFKNIEYSARRGIQLVSELLAYSHIDKSEKRVFSINTLISDILGICKTNISRKILLHHQLMPDLPPIEADLQQIQQVVITLCLSAAESMKEKEGILTITTGLHDVTEEFCKTFTGFLLPKVDSYVFFEIHDTGTFLDESEIQRLFDPYYRKEVQAGQDRLKLSTVLNIIQNNDGFIEVKSSREFGTSILVYLPITRKKIFSGEKELTRMLENVETVLLVDDEEIVQITIKRILKKLGYSVFTADNGQEAVQIFERLKDEIDLILLDLTMPVMGGADAITEIKKIKSDVNVILFSGFDKDEALRRLPDTNIVGFMEKPVLIDELGKRVQSLFKKGTNNH